MKISNMGGALEHWLGFQDKIGRSFMMNEDALKYPLADYLVNAGNIDIRDIELESPHPNLSNRFVDVSVLDESKNLKNVFELKLASTKTRWKSEKQRIFDDLMRLYLANIVTGGKCYFIITGKSAHFQRDFKEAVDFPNKVNRFYQKWFSFVIGQTQTFDVANETDTDYLSIYQVFTSEYSNSYKGIGTSVSALQLPGQITTTCEFITGFKETVVPYMTGIWSVS